MLDFGCTSDKVSMEQVASVRSWQDQFIYRVHACGHEARYACMVSHYDGGAWCTREPLDPPERRAP
jgi:hypothetical protein